MVTRECRRLFSIKVLLYRQWCIAEKVEIINQNHLLNIIFIHNFIILCTSPLTFPHTSLFRSVKFLQSEKRKNFKESRKRRENGEILQRAKEDWASVLRSVLRRCGSACCFPAKGRCLQERIRGPEVVGSTAPPITARPSLSTLPHVAVWKMSVCARCQVFRLSRVHTRLGKRGENNSFPR